MSKLLQLRGGTTTEHATFTGALREVTVDTTKDTLVVHDGASVGGFALPRTKADIDALNINADLLDGQHGSYYTGYADTVISNLVAAAPATLDTLNELAAALGDDPNFATTVTNSIATKLPLAGGTLTGNVNLGDNNFLRLGNDLDLQIFHNGADSYIYDSGTGNLNLTSDGPSISLKKHTGGENMLVATPDGAVTLYHDNAQKLATTATGIDVTGTAVTDGLTVDGTTQLEEVFERVTVSPETSGTATVNTQVAGIIFFNVNQLANRTVNFSNVNSNLDAGQSVTSVVLMAQGGTAYYLNAYQVDGSAVTPKWQGGSAPTAGNVNGIDSYSFTIIKTADATFTVLASQTQFA